MKEFYSKTTKGFYPEKLLPVYLEVGTLPDDLEEVTPAKKDEIRARQAAGEVELPNGDWVHRSEHFPEEQVARLMSIARRELTMARDELEKLADNDPTAQGTVGQWRAYRVQLRAFMIGNRPDLPTPPVPRPGNPGA